MPMTGKLTRFAVLLALVALTCSDSWLHAGDLNKNESAQAEPVALPSPTDVQALAVHPEKIVLKGSDDAQQLILTATLKDRLQDLSGDVKYEVADPKIVRVSSAGRVMPLANGSTEITVTFGDKAVKVP